jgi:phage terminase large subunit-like protein
MISCWADKLAAWENAQATWDMAQFGLRLGSRPRWLVTTTPKSIKLLRELLLREGRVFPFLTPCIVRRQPKAVAGALAGARVRCWRVLVSAEKRCNRRLIVRCASAQPIVYVLRNVRAGHD